MLESNKNKTYEHSCMKTEEDESSKSSISSFDHQEITDSYVLFMMIERCDLREFTTNDPELFRLIWIKGHEYENNCDNILHLSYTMHDWLDGVSDARRSTNQMKVPLIKLTATGEEMDEMKTLHDGQEIQTTKVYIKLWSSDLRVLNELQNMLKNGSYRDDDGGWITFVNVVDLTIFKKCLEWRAFQTQYLWDAIGGCPTSGMVFTRVMK